MVVYTRVENKYWRKTSDQVIPKASGYVSASGW